MSGLLRQPADVFEPTMRGSAPVRVYLVLEGERGELPVYCTTAPKLRVRGRAIPDRLVVTPVKAGFRGKPEIRWMELRPRPSLRGWERRVMTDVGKRWSYELKHFPESGDDTDSQFYGTARFAAAIDLASIGGPVLVTSGFERGSADRFADDPPGYRVTRYFDESLPGRALGLSRLPVVDKVSPAHVEQKIAYAPIDLVVAAYEELAGKAFRNPRAPSLDEFEWLFAPAESGLRRRTIENAPWVSPKSRGIPWAKQRQGPNAPGVRRSDVIEIDGKLAILDRDDGDGWLSDGDRVIHCAHGEVLPGKLGEITGRLGRVVRPHSFSRLKLDLAQAGYGELGDDWYFTAELERACKEFQRDRGLASTGIPDQVLRTALADFLAAMDGVDSTTP